MKQDWDPYDTLMELVNKHHQTQQQLQVIQNNFNQVAKAHNELRDQVTQIKLAIKTLKETIDEVTRKNG